jgi:hypothetical protein
VSRDQQMEEGFGAAQDRTCLTRLNARRIGSGHGGGLRHFKWLDYMQYSQHWQWDILAWVGADTLERTG